MVHTGREHHLENIGDSYRGPYKHHYQNWQFDVSLFEKGVSFAPFFQKKMENVVKQKGNFRQLQKLIKMLKKEDGV